MKKLNNKGFTLVEILVAVALLSILMAMAMTAFNTYKKKAKVQAYDTMAKSAKEAAENYLMDNPGAKRVTFDTLVEESYLNTISDPGKESSNCTGKVVMDKIVSANDKILDTYNFTVNMCCKKYNYTYMYPDDRKIEDEACKSALYDVNDITEIKVLNVYPNSAYANHLKNWMNQYGAFNGEQIIKVDIVSIENFNANPRGYLTSSGRWNYDVIVFGFADCNANKDLSEQAAEATRDFLNSGHSAIFGHDTITKGCGNHVNFISLKAFVALEMTSPDTTVQGTKLTIKKQGIFTQYPYNIGDVGTQLSIPKTHVYGQIANGNVWLTFSDATDPYRSIYLSTSGYNAFIQTGHTNGTATEEEKKIIANITWTIK